MVAEHLSEEWLHLGSAFFARKDCTPCAFRTRCTKAKAEPRIIGLQPGKYHEVLQEARQQQQTDTFRLQYAARAGIESTHELIPLAA